MGAQVISAGALDRSSPLQLLDLIAYVGVALLFAAKLPGPSLLLVQSLHKTEGPAENVSSTDIA